MFKLFLEDEKETDIEENIDDTESNKDNKKDVDDTKKEENSEEENKDGNDKPKEENDDIPDLETSEENSDSEEEETNSLDTNDNEEISENENKLDNNKLYQRFKDFKQLLQIIEDFNNSLSNVKNSLDNDEIDDSLQSSSINYIEESINKTQQDIKNLLVSIDNIELTKVDLLFTHFKTKINTLIDFSKNIIKTKQTNK